MTFVVLAVCQLINKHFANSPPTGVGSGVVILVDDLCDCRVVSGGSVDGAGAGAGSNTRCRLCTIFWKGTVPISVVWTVGPEAISVMLALVPSQ